MLYEVAIMKEARILCRLLSSIVGTDLDANLASQMSSYYSITHRIAFDALKTRKARASKATFCMKLKLDHTKAIQYRLNPIQTNVDTMLKSTFT